MDDRVRLKARHFVGGEYRSHFGTLLRLRGASRGLQCGISILGDSLHVSISIRNSEMRVQSKKRRIMAICSSAFALVESVQND